MVDNEEKGQSPVLTVDGMMSSIYIYVREHDIPFQFLCVDFTYTQYVTCNSHIKNLQSLYFVHIIGGWGEGVLIVGLQAQV